ncbi:MAG: hypothetical protein V4717_05990 [Bacteroidota bacterium]
MERVQSLINKLAAQANDKASASELLQTTALLYAELRSYNEQVSTPLQNGISVWLPLGYSQKAGAPTVSSEQVDVEKEENLPAEIITDAVKSVSNPILQPGDIEAKTMKVPQPPTMPVPPAQVKILEVEPPIAAIAQPGTIPAQDPDLLFTLHSNREEAVKTTEESIQKPVATPTPETVKSESPNIKPFPQYPDVSTLMKNIFPVAPDPTPVAREVNQLVVDPAIPLNEKLMEKKVELAEVLAAGPKITDLRKAFTINDKYQMINVLFRGDENMFERSIRTLNNFGSLPEARFWMQRELVVKLGWDEKEETVQRFQALVNRRFA